MSKESRKVYTSPALTVLGDVGQVTAKIDHIGSGGLGLGLGNSNAHGGNPHANDNARK